MTWDNIKLCRTLWKIEQMLVGGDYASLASKSVGRLNEEQLRATVENWPYFPFVLPPEPSQDKLVSCYGELENEPFGWWINMLLWTTEEGKSDLTMSVTLFEGSHELYEFTVDDLDVL